MFADLVFTLSCGVRLLILVKKLYTGSVMEVT